MADVCSHYSFLFAHSHLDSKAPLLADLHVLGSHWAGIRFAGWCLLESIHGTPPPPGFLLSHEGSHRKIKFHLGWIPFGRFQRQHENHRAFWVGGRGSLNTVTPISHKVGAGLPDMLYVTPVEQIDSSWPKVKPGNGAGPRDDFGG